MTRNLHLFLYSAAFSPKQEHFPEPFDDSILLCHHAKAHTTRTRSTGAKSRQQEHLTASLATFEEKNDVCVSVSALACIRGRVRLHRSGGRRAQHVR